MIEIKPAKSLTAAKRLSRQATDLHSSALTLERHGGNKDTIAYLKLVAEKLANASREYYVRNK